MEANSGSWDQPDSVLVPENTLQALLGVSGPDLSSEKAPHSPQSFLLPARPAFFATAGEIIYGGPSPCLGGFQAETLLLVAFFDVGRLTLLFFCLSV